MSESRRSELMIVGIAKRKPVDCPRRKLAILKRCDGKEMSRLIRSSKQHCVVQSQD